VDVAQCTNLPLTIVFLPAADIAKYVGEGNVDVGITGLDVVEETREPVEVALVCPHCIAPSSLIACACAVCGAESRLRQVQALLTGPCLRAH
jgi:hypothetical protein